MGFKQYGPGTSENPQSIVTGGQFSAEDKSFETIVIETAKPVIDWEINLQEEVSNDQGSRLQAQRLIPSCFIEVDFLETADIRGSYIGLPAVPPNSNIFQIKKANFTVNGWPLRFEYSGISTTGLNSITLPAPPVGAGVFRTDLVIIEVWRALITAAPSVVNKSPTSLILRLGNVKAPDAVNLIDDLIDPIYTLESSKRVQIQYRYRVISGIDVTAYPDGLDSPAVFANTVSDFSGPGADGTVTAFNYVKSSIDPGLWIAGSGTAITAAALGTVDGFMYAIPLCAVFRRNSTAFNRSTNLNGGGTFPGVSGRPDGLYSNQIILSDIKDLRKSVAWDLNEVLQKAFQQVLDNSLQTEHEIDAFGSGTSHFKLDSLGTSSHPGNPDGVRLNFSDRAITENIVCKTVIGGAPTLSITILLTALPIVQGPGIAVTNVAASAPVGTAFAGVLQIRSVTAVADVATAVTSVVISPGSITINFPVALINTDIYTQVQISYPLGSGLTQTPIEEYQFWSPDPTTAPWNTWVDPAFFTATSDAGRFSLDPTLWKLDFLHRELSVRYVSVNQIVTIPSNTATNVKIPERIKTTAPGVTVNDGINPIYTTTTITTNTSYTDVTLSIPVPIGTPITVTYKALRPLPPVGVAPWDSHQIFYKSRSVQSLDVPAGNVNLSLIPRVISNLLYTITSGSGSPDSSHPFISPGTQIPIGKLPSANFPEAELDTSSVILLPFFNIDSGMAQLPTLLPYAPNPDEVNLVSGALDVTVDADGRNFWPKVDPLFYAPSAFSYPYNFPQKHKVALPALMELKQDFASIGRKGTLVLVVFSGWFDISSTTPTENSIKFLSVPSDFCAAIYRVRGHMLNPRKNQS